MDRQKLATSLGRSVSDITESDVNEYLHEGAVEAVSGAMQTCMETAETSSSRQACRLDNTRSTLMSSLALDESEVTDVMVQDYLEEATAGDARNLLRK